jgi:hypothetical protein
MQLSSINESFDTLHGKRVMEVPDLENENPILILIIAEGGVLVFSYPFSDEWKRDNEQFGSFLSAFTSFSDEYFSEELDRARFGKYTVFLSSIDKFLICYLFKGQSYMAQQKLSKFTEHLSQNTSIQKTLANYYETGQVLETQDFPFLESLIKEIFE